MVIIINGPIRVLHVLGRLDRGGAETMVMNLYRNIDRSKIQFDFMVHTSEDCDYDEEIIALGGKIYSISAYSGKNHFEYKKEWHNFFQEHTEYKIVHGHVRSTAAIYLKIAKKHGMVTIAHSHNTSSGKGISATAKNIMQYPIRHTADYLLACSEYAGEWLFGKRVKDKNNFFILKNAINAEEFIYDEATRNEIRKELGIENKFILGNVARFHEQKNHTFLIDVFKNVHDKNNESVLLLVGQGDLKQEIKDKVSDLGLTDSVIFTGVRSDVPDLLQVMDVFVFPSLYEGLGIVAVEAQAAGLKCVVADSVPKEAFVTDLISSVSLKDSSDIWADRILKETTYDRRNTYQEIYDSGYEVKDTSKWIESFYISKAFYEP